MSVCTKKFIPEGGRFGDWTYSTDSSSGEVLARLTNREGGTVSWKRDEKPFDKGTYKSVFQTQEKKLCVSVAVFEDKVKCFSADKNEELLFVRLNEAFRKKETDHIMHSVMTETLLLEGNRVQIIIQPFFREGTLLGLIVPHNKLLPEDQEGKDRKGCTIQVLEAVTYLHENGIYHQDIKWNNFLVENKGKVRRIVLTDFGLSVYSPREGEEAETDAYMRKSFRKSLVSSYACPDFLQEKNTKIDDFPCLVKMAEKQDIWGTAIVLYGCIHSEYPSFVNLNSTSQTKINLVENKKGRERHFTDYVRWKKKSPLQEVIEKMFNRYLSPREALEHLFPVKPESIEVFCEEKA